MESEIINELQNLIGQLLEEARRVVQDEHQDPEQVCDRLLSELECSVPGISAQRVALIEYLKQPKVVS